VDLNAVNHQKTKRHSFLILAIDSGGDEQRQNLYIEPTPLPSGLGYECAGVIEAVGPDVKNFKVGDRVSTYPAHSQGEYGAYGKLVVMPIVSVAPYPANLSATQAAAYWQNSMTGYFAIVEMAHLVAGQTILNGTLIGLFQFLF
jgi:NADPH:quinone reductase-like Zn-dependent oxidoreductase